MSALNLKDYPNISPVALAAVNRLNENLAYVKSKCYTSKLAIEHDTLLAQRALIEAGEALLTNQKEILLLMREGFGDIAGTFNAYTLQYKAVHLELLEKMDEIISYTLQAKALQQHDFH